MVTRFLILLLLCVPAWASAQTLTGDRVRATERILIGTGTFGTTSPLQIAGLPAKGAETNCLWVDGSGNVTYGACGSGDVTGVSISLGTDADDLLAVTGSPCTSGDCAFTVNFNAQSNGVVLAGPTTGGPLDPTFRQLLLDELGNPSGNKTFTMANKTLVFSYTAPTGGDGAFEIEAVGGFTGDLLHLHQLTGNPGAGTDLAHFESSDVDVTGLRITANAAATALNVASGLTQLTGNTTVTGTLTVSSTVAANGGSITSTGALALTPASGNLTLNPSGDVEFNPTGNDLLPTSNYDLNIGALNKKYLSLHAAELWVETLVAQNTIATIGGRILVGPTTVFTADLAATPCANPQSSGITVKHNEMAVNDIVYAEANGAVEFFRVTAGPGGSAGAYTYTVTRTLDTVGGCEAWVSGDALFNTGTTNDGFIDLYSVRGVKSVSEAGPTIVGNVRTNTGYNDWAARWAIGNLNGLYGYGAATYGVAMGDPNEANIVIDATNGIRIRDGTTEKLTMDTSGNLSLVGDIVMGTGGVIRSGATALDTGTGYWLAHNSGTPQFRIGDPSGSRLKWDSGTLTLVSQYFTVGATGTSIATSTSDFFSTRAYRFSDHVSDGYAFGLYGYSQSSPDYYRYIKLTADNYRNTTDSVSGSAVVAANATNSSTTTSVGLTMWATVLGTAEDSNSTWSTGNTSITQRSGLASDSDGYITITGDDLLTANAAIIKLGPNATEWVGVYPSSQTTTPGNPWLVTNGNNFSINSDSEPMYFNNYSAQPIYHYGDGYTYLYKSGGPNILFWRDTSGTADPTFTTRSAGTRMVLYPSISSVNADYGFGINSGYMWASIPQATAGYSFRVYGGTTEAARLSGDGSLILTSTAPYIQMWDTTTSATDYFLVNDSNALAVWSGTYGSGTQMVLVQTSGGSNTELVLKGKTSHSSNGNYGAMITLERSTGTANTPGMVLFQKADGNYSFMWVGDDGILYLGAAPEGDGSPANNSGTVVGGQSSSLVTKNILGERFDPATSLDLVLNTRVFDFTYKSGAYRGETFTGIVTDYSPWFGMNDNQVLNPVNSTGHLVQAIKALEARLRAVENNR